MIHPTSDPAAHPLRLVIYREGLVFIAQCLDFDIAGHGESVEAARAAFIDAYRQHVTVALHLGREPFEDLPPASAECWRRWVEGVEDRRLPPQTTEIPPLAVSIPGQRRRQWTAAERPAQYVVA